MRDDATTVLLYYNLSTVLTLFLCVLSLYVALVVLVLGGSLVVIDPDFMSGSSASRPPSPVMSIWPG
ncbi:hypothetical protein ACTXKZ_11070 [Brachybacterium alimentarium]|uniref:hypothetical protein n=1 Tax=Brachybacterium alimentarium TaxID=47845 RepID=UPI003FD195DC